MTLSALTSSLTLPPAALPLADAARWMQQLEGRQVSVLYVVIALLGVVGVAGLLRAMLGKQRRIVTALAVVCLAIGALGGFMTMSGALSEGEWALRAFGAAKPQTSNPLPATPASLVDAPAVADISSVKFPADGKIDFVRDVQPILAHNCYECHSASKRRGELRLDNKDAAFAGGKIGSTLLPHDPEQSVMIRRVLGLDGLKRMPLGGEPLPEEHVRILRTWIEQGAKWPDHASVDGGREETHWAYVKPKHPDLPAVKNASWPRNGIDHFVLARLEQEGMQPSPEADRATLIRRLSLDLIGLPPTPEEVDAFVNNPSASAYDELVNRLLASPHYGERWGRHWLDIARYADTNGYEKDNPREIWPYRDWVINALNRDVTFDQFTIKQIAGDMLPNATPDDKIATGFHRNTMFNEEGGINAEEFRFLAMVDRVQTTSTAFLGLTMQCAQCHDHKYDKLSQKEYYQFFAFLNSADEPDYEIPSNEIALQHQQIDQQIAAAKAALESQFPTHEEVLEYLPLQPSKLTAQSGVTFARQEDGSYLAQGKRAETDVYTVELPAEFANLTGIKIETLTHDSLPNKGPGRARNGNFALTEVKATATVTGSAQATPLTLVSPIADYNQPEWEAPKSIDGNPNTGWAVSEDGNGGKNRAITYRFKDAPASGSGTITLTLEQSLAKHSIGRFRISLINAKPAPKSDLPVEQQRAAFLAAKMIAWEQQLADKLTHWTTLDPVEFERGYQGTMTELPDHSVLVTGDGYYRDQYRFFFEIDPAKITAFRLEVLPHEDLPKGGPARGKNGGGLLSEFTVTTVARAQAGEEGVKPPPVALQNVSADASPDTVGRAIDQKLDTHWSVPAGATRTLVVQTKDPSQLAAVEGKRLQIDLDSNYHQNEAMGRVRFAFTTDEKPAVASGLPAAIESILLTPSDQRSAAQQAKLKKHFLMTTPLLAQQQQHIAALRSSKQPYQTTLVMKERAVPRVTRIHHRGEFYQPREAIDHPAVPAVLPQIPEGAPLNRLTLARWLVSEENPLTARVTVNRIWMRYFGRGIVNTVLDFGVMGEKPSHPALLDWLATEFQRQNWSLKALHRLIVTSATYRQSSFVSEKGAERDPQNVLLARGPRVRVEAEIVRDIALAAAGLLNERVGGPSVFPPQPPGVSELSYGPLKWVTSVGPDRYRRGMYTFIKRTSIYPGLTTFDAPTSEVVCARRTISNTPLQALTTLNDEVFVEAAQAMARRVAEEALTPDERLQRLFRLCVAREPDQEEFDAVKAYYEKQLERFQTDMSANAAIVAFLDPTQAERFELPSDMDMPELAAMTVTARSVLNLDETITKE